MFKCVKCGGPCTDKGDGTYKCKFCGSYFTAADFNPAQRVVHAAENVDSGADLYDSNVGGVLEVTVPNVSSGSGYIVRGDGYAVTNSHVVALADGRSCGQCYVKVAGENIPAQVIAMGTENVREHCTDKDLALLKLSHMPRGAVALKLGDYASVRTGERIFVIGNSLGYGTCITSGIVSDSNRNGKIMYDCATNPGNSGGPVFNAEGLVIGTHVAGTNGRGDKAVQGMNFAIPCNAVINFLSRCGIKL